MLALDTLMAWLLPQSALVSNASLGMLLLLLQVATESDSVECMGFGHEDPARSLGCRIWGRMGASPP